MNKRICCIFNVAPHYNAPIYKLMDAELCCDFYFGNRIHLPIKLMSYSELRGYKETLKYKPLFSKFYWQKRAINKLFRPYSDYILTGEVYCLSTWVILLFSRLTKKRTYLWTHGWYGNETPIKKIIKRIFFNLSTHTLLYGNYARNLMIENGFNPNKLSCIYNSLDYNKQLYIRENMKGTSVYTDRFKNTYPVLFYIGRIQKNKRLDILIKALEILKEKSIDCNLVIIGEEVEKTGIVDQITNNNLTDNIWMYGACYDESNIGELIYNADICVSPGNVGLTAIHSLMYGTPVITHNEYSMQGPEFEAIIDGLTGTFFKNNNIFDLVEKIILWLNNTKKDRENIRNSCYKIIDDRYNPNAQIDILKNIFFNKRN